MTSTAPSMTPNGSRSACVIRNSYRAFLHTPIAIVSSLHSTMSDSVLNFRVCEHMDSGILDKMIGGGWSR
jgi:hypothetical protein